jgi:thiamine-monophosphate kinase
VGWSGAGLALLEAGRPDLSPELVAAHLRPEPPYAAGPTAALAGATAMLDVSDGLLLDAGRVASASGVTIDLDLAALRELAEPLLPAADALGDNALGLVWVLGGGEDHPLLACFPPGALPSAFVPVGVVVEAAGPGVLLSGGQPAEVVGPVPGWDHYRR